MQRIVRRMSESVHTKAAFIHFVERDREESMLYEYTDASLWTALTSRVYIYLFGISFVVRVQLKQKLRHMIGIESNSKSTRIPIRYNISYAC